MRRDPSIRPWTLLSLLLIAVSLLGISPEAEAHRKRAFQQETFQITQLHTATASPVPTLGAVRLNRTRDELWASFHVSDLVENSAYTIWAAIFNRPEACMTNPDADARCSVSDLMAMPNEAKASAFNVGAFLTGSDGTANISIHIRSGSPPDGAFVLFGKGGLNDNGVRPGLHKGNGLGAEVHLIIRTHGDILADAITDQLSLFNGGCPDDPPLPCANVQMAVFPRVQDDGLNPE